ncbi:hypothetical protein [Streptomyces bicolor]|uniref:hypothetical protein n=1 Tax=Streptomyces bicolor TaxID=66874 RepID=UPI0004E1F5DE|nr:hypothetical protein [Streptomyces bicolor]
MEPGVEGGRLSDSGVGAAGIGRSLKVVSAAVSAGAPVRRGVEARSPGRGGMPPGAACPAASWRNDPPLSGRPAVGGASGKRAEARGGGGSMGSASPEAETRRSGV